MRAIIYGIGRRYFDLFFHHEQIDMGLIRNQVEVVGFSDGNSNTWGNIMLHDGQLFIVKNICDFPTKDFDRIVVTTKEKFKEIQAELLKKGYKMEQIILIDTLFEPYIESISYLDSFFVNRQWEKLLKAEINIGNFLKTRNYEDIAIYGMGELTECLIAKMNLSEVKVRYLISFDVVKEFNGISVYNPDGKLPMVDLIIVVAYEDYMKIECEISKRNRIPLISIQEFIYKILKIRRGRQEYA